MLLSWFVGLRCRLTQPTHTIFVGLRYRLTQPTFYLIILVFVGLRYRLTQPTFYSLPILLSKISFSEEPHIWS